ncbi:NlpC/P60 family protein [Paenibacillus assamensis]|uniref:C40 family peptidase n=1 Tax=Paenibacillus assamensis TaxID=311244 RepID=UPI00048D09EC|nr:NlpC/P60 family protein [Paenibacillus assamensis]
MKTAIKTVLLAGAVFGCMLFTDGALGTKAYAYDGDKKASITINGQQLTFTNTVPVLEDGETMYVPLRDFVNKMGWTMSTSNINSNHMKIIVKSADATVEFRTDSATVKVNGKSVKMSDKPWLYKDTTYIPLRFFVDEMGVKFTWDSKYLKTIPSVDRYKKEVSIQSSKQDLSKADAVINTAYSYLGVPYVWGGTTPAGFDCSGFLNYVFGKHNVELPRTAHDIYKNAGTAVKNPQKGDLVFFSSSGSRITHIGIYLGDNQYIHASSGKVKGVTVSSLGSSWSSKTYVGAKRVL